MRRAKDHFPGDKATHEWLHNQKYATRAAYTTSWKRFLEFVGMTGDEILASRKADKTYAWEKRTLEFKRWMLEEKGKAEKTATASAAAVRAFFSFHRVSLEFRRGERQRLKEAKTKFEDYRFSKEDLAKMASVADLTEKYVLVVGKSFGLRAGDFLALTRGDLEAYIDCEVPISIGEYATQKESVSAFPMIDRDALPVIKLMLENMDRHGRTEPSDRMLMYKDQIQLSRIVRRLAERAGIKIGNKRVRFHCLRKFLIDHLSSFMSESKWKQIVGKTISEGAYVSPDSLRTDYERAMAETTFTKPSDADKSRREAFLDMVGATYPEYLAQIKEIMDKELNTDKAIDSGQKIIAKAKMEGVVKIGRNTETNGGCQNGHCQRIVSEVELPTMLAEGWRVAAVLPSGKVVVSSS